jgi:hypothetical protein
MYVDKMRGTIFGCWLLLAAYASVGAVSAADPAVERPLDWVAQCGEFGSGYVLVPGAQTCLKIGLRLRADYRVYDEIGDEGTGDWRIRARSYLFLDARQKTDLGLLRAFLSPYFTMDESNDSAGATTSTSVTLQYAFVQLGGLTAGRATSFFDFYLTPVYSDALEPAQPDNQTNLLAYTLGTRRHSATISLEGGTQRRYGATAAPGLLPPDITDATGNAVPDLILAGKMEREWAKAQVMGMLRSNDTLVPGVARELGWAFGIGAIFAFPRLGNKDEFGIQAVLSSGAIGYTFDGTSVDLSDFFVTSDRRIAQAISYSVVAGFEHWWSERWKSGFAGSFLRVDQPQGSTPSFSQWDLQGNLVFFPEPGFQIGAELEWRKSVPSGSESFTEIEALLRIQRTY